MHHHHHHHCRMQIDHVGIVQGFKVLVLQLATTTISTY